MACYRAPREWEEWCEWLAAGLHGRSRWRLPLLMMGILYAGGRRVVASWIRTAGVSDDYQDYYFFLQSVGKRWRELGRRVLVLVLDQVLRDQPRIVLAVDDSPTKRYGLHVEGAGIHHDPTPGPVGHLFCYGHIWVTLAVIVRHPWWGTIGLPIWSWLYVRKQDVPQILKRHRWVFQTRLQQAADLVQRAVETLQVAGKELWVVADGAYAKRAFVRPVLALGVTLVGRFRKDSALFNLPGREKVRRRGRPRKYGRNRISLTKRAAHPGGWESVACTVYGVQTVKRVKTFLATQEIFGRVIRVVIIDEKPGPLFLYCTNPHASAQEIIEIFSDRAAIEQVFHDVKEIWGSGQQQVRNLWTNIGVWNLNLWMHTLVELWAWRRTAKQLTRRGDSPWDTQERRPSHADRRKSLQAACLREEFTRGRPSTPLPRKFARLLQRLLRVAV
jgi:hypothetical protein